MGLDMFLNKVKRIKDLTLEQIIETASYVEYLDDERAKSYTFKEWCGGDEGYVVKSEIENVKQNMHEEKIGDDYSYKTILYEIAYWRKANQIHRWFVENVQNGVDDCGRYEVTKEQITELLNVTNKVLNNPESAETLLPTQSGFFFGDTEYDRWYYKDLNSTKEQLEKALSETDFEHEIVYYHSSW